jgi:hypothetical protein
MSKVKVGQIWKDKVEDADGGVFLIKEILSTSVDYRQSSIYVNVYFLTGKFSGMTRNWYVDQVDVLVADNA